MDKAGTTNNTTQARGNTTTGISVALWWLRHYETITHFWKGFSWVWVIGVLLLVMVGHLDLGRALCFILLIGVTANTGIYLGIKTAASYLKHLEDGPEKTEAHELMIKIIGRRVPMAG